MGACCCDVNRHFSKDKSDKAIAEEKKLLTGRKGHERRTKTGNEDEKSRENRVRRQMHKHKPVGVQGLLTTPPLTPSHLRSHPLSPSDKSLIFSALHHLFLFQSLTPEEWDQITASMSFLSLLSGEVLYKEGESSDQCFILSTGELEKVVSGKVTGRVLPGHCIGAIALLHATARSSTVRCVRDCELWGLERDTFRRIVKNINGREVEENERFLESLEVFRGLRKRQKEKLVEVLVTTKHEPGRNIVTQGELGDVCFIIKEGAVVCLKDGKEVRRLGKGDLFGEQALLYGGVRTATVTAVTLVKCLSINSNDLTSALGRSLPQIIYLNTLRMSFDHHPHLRHLTKDQVDKVSGVMTVQSFEQDEVVIHRDRRKKSGIWVVARGELESQDQGVIGMFQVLGDPEFKENQTFGQDVTVKTNSADVAYISESQFLSTLGGSLSLISHQNSTISLLSSMTLLRTLSKKRLLRLLKALQLRSYSDREYIVRQHESGNSFYIVESGEVEVIKDGVGIRRIRKMDYFGERAVLSGERRTASIQAVGEVRCWELKREDFIRLIEEKVRKELGKRIEMQDDRIEISDLIYVKTLGRGMFGVVLLAVHPSSHRLYAIKSINKHKISLYHLKDNLIMERNTLRQLDHNFIVKLIKTSRDAGHVHFVLEFVRGKDLFDALREMEYVLGEKDTKFYISCLLIVLEYLHDRDIIHRDLKPENVIIDEHGYPKLIDFGTAKIAKERCYTIIGTPHYMAPEVILGKGYTAMADYWSLGIMMYEMMCGKVPFGEEEENPVKLYEHILTSKLAYPPTIPHQQLSSSQPIIERLLNRNPGLRLPGSLSTFKKNPWFSDIDWVRHT